MTLVRLTADDFVNQIVKSGRWAIVLNNELLELELITEETQVRTNDG